MAPDALDHVDARLIADNPRMYLEHYGLTEAPFALTPDPRYVWLGAAHQDALAHLRYGLEDLGHGGFVALTGEIGSGKTTIVRLALEQRSAQTRVALVLNPLITPLELVQTLLDELALARPTEHGMKPAIDALNAELLRLHAAGERVVIVVDEAQQLPAETVEQLRLLTNLETATHKLLRVILVGQPELRERLASPALENLSQRITARFHLSGLTRSESEAYLRHRYRVAGGRRWPFTRRALDRLHLHARGIPRRLNALAERALLAGYAHELEQISGGMIDTLAQEMHDPPARSTRRLLLLGGLPLLAVALVWSITQWPDSRPAPAPTTAAEGPTWPPVRPATINDLAARWALTGDPCATPGEVACLRGRGTLALLALIDRPALLELGPQSYLLDAVAPNRVTLGGVDVARELIEARYTGSFVVLCAAPEDGDLNALVQTAAASLGSAEPNSVAAIQATLGLKVDGILGPTTRAWLGCWQSQGPRLARPTPL